MAEDWLPHEAPTEPAKKPNRATRTLATWVVLLVMFSALYWMFSTTPAHSPKAVVVEGYSGWWIWFAAAVGLLPMVVVGWQLRGGGRFQAAILPAQTALADGNHQRAIDLFRELLARYRTQVNYRAAIRYNIGYALTRSGDSATAAGELIAVERTPKLGMRSVHRLVRVELSRAFAIGGDLDKAASWLAAARTSPGDLKGDAKLDAMQGLLLCRQGKLDEAKRHYEQCWRRLESQLTVDEMCEPWLLRAYAVARLSSPREIGTADTWMQLVRSSPAGLEWLTARWPELATFVVANGLAVTATARAS
jgi:tetratricopeptide (TPR) repeat protein